MKRKRGDLSPEDAEQTLAYLFSAARHVRGKAGAEQLLADLLTPSEQLMLGRRIWIARLLLAGRSRAEIGEQLQVGPNTISRVQEWLDDRMPNYKEVLQELQVKDGSKKQHNTKSANVAPDYDPLGFAALKRRYPLHFLLFPGPTAPPPPRRRKRT